MISDRGASTHVAICNIVDSAIDKKFKSELRLKTIKNIKSQTEQKNVAQKMTWTGRVIKESVLGGKGKPKDSIINTFCRCFGEAIMVNKKVTLQ